MSKDKYQELRDALDSCDKSDYHLHQFKNAISALLADADRADALETALVELMNSTGGGNKSCGHSFTCGCAWKVARAALSQGEQNGINQV